MPRSPRLLRLSITDRCNLRCRYCMPAEGVPKIAHNDLLSLERLAEVARWLCATVGIERIKLTGGEPLVRSGIDRLITLLGSIPGVREVSLTTNGSLLAWQAKTLKQAGLARVTISLDSLDRERYRELTRGGRIEDALAGIEAALAARLTPVKLNAVLQRSTWIDEVPRLLDYAAQNGLAVRFIELMRTGTEREWCNSEFAPSLEVRQWLSERAQVLPIAVYTSAPALLTRVFWRGTALDVGWIAPRSQPFCDRCDRLRLDARGRLHRCLMDPRFLELAPMLESGDGTRAADALSGYLAGKLPAQRMERAESMIQIGG
jgi:cyclic pyranopterin phosphate synthase